MTARIYDGAGAEAIVSACRAQRETWRQIAESDPTFRVDGAEAEALRLTQERDALRAIIEGRTVPPTDAEIAAHHAAGGRWRCLVPNRLWQSKDAMHDSTARIQRATLEVDGGPAVWWSIDSTGRPCAWPVVAEVTQ